MLVYLGAFSLVFVIVTVVIVTRYEFLRSGFIISVVHVRKVVKGCNMRRNWFKIMKYSVTTYIIDSIIKLICTVTIIEC